MVPSPHPRRVFLERATALALACALPGCQPRADGPVLRFGVITDIANGPDGAVWVVSLSNGAMYGLARQ